MQLITLPNRYWNGSKDPLDWPGAHPSGAYTRSNRSHLSGTTTTDQGKSLDETIDSSREGSIYDDPNGFMATVQTKTSTVFKSKHFIGHLNGNSISKNSTINSSTQSCWIHDVVGFHCEFSSEPKWQDSSISDGCGRVDSFRVCAVYADQSNKCHIMEMTHGGTKISSASYNSYPGNSWTKFSYMLGRNDGLTVINNQWMLYGWIIRMEHKKTCGGGTKQKNCSGRMRYLRPIITPDMTQASGVQDSQLVQHWGTTLSEAVKTTGRQLQAY